MSHRDPEARALTPGERRAVERRVELVVFLACVAVVVSVGLMARQRDTPPAPPAPASLSWPVR